MESSFQFSNPQLLKFTFELNSEFKEIKGEKMNVPHRFFVQKGQIEYKDETEQIIVALEMVLGSEEENSPFKINIVEAAKFSWRKDSFDSEKLEKLIKYNAPALLLSYMRPLVTQVTASSKFPTYQVPFIDFTKVFPAEEKLADAEVNDEKSNR